MMPGTIRFGSRASGRSSYAVLERVGVGERLEGSGAGPGPRRGAARSDTIGAQEDR